MKVSVIVPIYGVEKYLVDFLDCLMKTSLKDVEFILVNDASIDNCHEIISKKFDSRVVYINKKNNEGLYKARQDAFYIAKGEYIINLDPDDLISDDYISKLYFFAKENELDIVLSNVNLIGENGEKILNKKANVHSKNKIFNSDNAQFILSFPYATWCRMFKRTILISASYKYKYGELLLTNFHFIPTVKSGICADCFYYYRIRTSSMSSHSNSIVRLKNSISEKSIERFFADLPSDIERNNVFSAFNYYSYIKLIYTSCLGDKSPKSYISLEKKLKKETKFKKKYLFKTFSSLSNEMKVFSVIDFFGLIPLYIYIRSKLKGF